MIGGSGIARRDLVRADHLRAPLPAPVPVLGSESRAMAEPAETTAGIRRRPPRAAVVAIKPAPGESVSEVLRRTKNAISLQDLDIEDSRLRKAANGNLLIEILGPENAQRADLLAQKLRAALGDAAFVSRSTIRADCR